jgi:acyl-CoA dehydrogenase
VAPYLQEWEDAGEVPRSLHLAAARQGLLGIAFAESVGGEALTEAYVEERETFGRPLVSNQVVRHRLVEMQRLTRAARCYVRDTAARHVAGEGVTLDACLAKQTAVEAAVAVCDMAVQLHGGTGYLHGAEVERHCRDARILPIGGGATEVLTDLAARSLGYA